MKASMRKVCIVIVLMILSASAYKGGVYIYRNKRNNNVHYVGMTNNFDRRHREHNKDHRYLVERTIRWIGFI
jgi:predicted GIY-YIG superfamily endonuclease